MQHSVPRHVRNFLLGCAMGATVMAPALADEAGAQNRVQLSANASIEVQQDLLTLSLATTRDGTDPAWLQTQLRQALDAALALAKPMVQAGAMELHTGQFNLQPRYGRDGKIVNWVGSTELVLEGRDFARIGNAAAKIQSLVVTSASFGLSREQRARAEAEAQANAIESFKTRANAIAHGFGFADYSLRDIVVSANDVGVMPRPRMQLMTSKAMAEEAPQPLESGKSTVTVVVSGSVQLR